MRKCKILISLLTMCLIVLSYEVKAAAEIGDKQITDTSQLMAKCVYKYEHANTGTVKWDIYVNKKYEISGYSADVEYGEFIYTKQISSTFKFTYEDYLDENSNFSCDKIKKLYVDNAIVGSDYEECGDFDGACNSYTFGPNKEDFAYTLFGKKEYSYVWEAELVPEESKVYVENADKEAVESGNWDLACHYGPFYLYYNDTTFETNADSKDLYTYEKISEIINENYGSCPNAFCEYIDTYSEVLFSFFTNEYESRDGCYVSQQYTGGYKCGMLENRMNLYHTAHNDKDNQLIVKIRNDVKNFCSNVLSHLNYTDPNNCIKECMEVVGILQKDENLTSGQCGLSGKLILWIANIVKWVKYIVPVIAIVMGILDFIKAIANGKDDEIKKAQGHFVKRLIAAALIFITPFIIEFILDKMGFDANGCGIIDL